MTALTKRVAGLPTNELASWASQTLFEIGRNVDRFARTQEGPYILQAKKDVEALAAVVDEMARRSA